ncbi:MAG: RidA family protein [Desulfovibrio sp.]|nr:RidA family protein [Desulfovibrio sp.]
MAKEPLTTTHAPQAVGPYSQAICANNFLFASGQIALDPATNKLVDGDIQAQTTQICNNIAHILATKNLTFQDVVKTTVFITDMTKFAQVNATYGQFFSSPCPARSCVEVSKLPLGALVEIEVIAALP